MNVPGSGGKRLLMLGPAEGWHAEQLRRAAGRLGHHFDIACYESLRAGIDHRGGAEADAAGADAAGATELDCRCGRLTDYDAILTRTMPAASMERITFRLAMLHTI